MDFVADCMLGRLARWLKILGFDVLYFPKAEDKDLVTISRQENRVLLTRDTGLIEKTKRRAGRLFVVSNDWRDQVVQVLDEYDLWDAVRPNSRCLDCNMPLRELPRPRARNLVPPHILETAPSFSMCPGCGRIFWPGSHSDDMETKIAALRRRSRRGSYS